MPPIFGQFIGTAPFISFRIPRSTPGLELRKEERLSCAMVYKDIKSLIHFLQVALYEKDLPPHIAISKIARLSYQCWH